MRILRMRLVQVLIPAGTRESVVDSLDEQGLDYALFEEVGRGDFEGWSSFPSRRAASNR